MWDCKTSKMSQSRHAIRVNAFGLFTSGLREGQADSRSKAGDQHPSDEIRYLQLSIEIQRKRGAERHGAVSYCGAPWTVSGIPGPIQMHSTFGLCTRKVASLSRTHDRKPNVFERSVHRSREGFRSDAAPHGAVKAPSQKERHST